MAITAPHEADLDRLPRNREPAERALSLPDRRGPEGVDQLVGQAVRRMQ